MVKKNQITMDMIIEMAKEQLAKHGDFVARAFVIDDKNRISIVMLEFDTDEEKIHCVNVLRKIVKKLRSNHYFFVTDGWMAIDNPDLPAVRPSRRVDRKECLIFNEFQKGEQSNGYVQLYSKKGNKIIFEDSNEMKLGFHRWDVFKEKGAFDEQMRIIREKHNKEWLDKQVKDAMKENEQYWEQFKAGKITGQELAIKIIDWGEKRKSEYEKKIYEHVD